MSKVELHSNIGCYIFLIKLLDSARNERSNISLSLQLWLSFFNQVVVLNGLILENYPQLNV